MINQIKEDIKQAMRDRDKVRLSTLRMLMSTMDNERIKLRVDELNEEQSITCINRNLKQLDQEIESLIKANRNFADALLQYEILHEYLPQQLSEEEIRENVAGIVTIVKTEGGKFGDVMKSLSVLKGKADMKLVSKIAKELF
jgi:uncharacterized protein